MKKRDELLKIFLDTFGFNFRNLPGNAFELALLTACDPDTPCEILELLAQADHPVLLQRIAEHPNVKPFLLEILASNPHPDVRAAVAENCNVPLEILLRLCNDEHPDVRYSLAENPCLPRAVLNYLSDDINPYVANRARVTMCRLDQPETGIIRNIVHRLSTRFAQGKAV